jgi:chromate transporter
VLGLFGIFLPGILILLGTLPFWDTFRKRANAQAVMRGVNAAVVGLLGARSTIRSGPVRSKRRQISG